jgi:hypothetical protein
LRRSIGIIAHHAKRIAHAVLELPGRVFFGVANPIARLLARSGHPIDARGTASGDVGFRDVDELVEHHFSTRSDPGHINFSSLRDTLRLLGGEEALILETGSSAWGTDSSRLFASYVAAFGGEFLTVDIRVEPLLALRRTVTGRTALYCDDSIRFLKRWVAENPGRRVDLVYLDSFDLDVLAPVKAATHGLEELFAIAPALRDGSLLLVDDTPSVPELLPVEWQDTARDFQARFDMVPGKGMLIDRYLKDRPDVSKIHHGYQVLYRF